ncbi:quercetin 2,3-dioxygenase [Tepidiforma sp.]|uniref:quercetin 2,3-dioxygenase n=1 Tax=Tepidiforma sp. TaxID=2682230 RepID=UPI002ADD3393|nr:quercetin 2,3-dioxygenase [Tepidiforma sp.]
MEEKPRAYVLAVEEGEAIWFAGALMVLKATGDRTGGRFAFMDQRTPGDYAVPRHVHGREDESWYILEGEVTFYCGDETFTAGPGAWVFAPKGIPHAFRVGPAGARLLTMAWPAGFADFVRAAGQPASALTLPEPAPLDIEQLTVLGRQHGIEIVGPPPS